MSSYIKLINHASVLISNGRMHLLTDPWYSGLVFNDGWRLLHENPECEINALLQSVSHIWLSHEHPDHFSVPFFKKYCKLLISQGVVVLFQRTPDGRVARFLRSLGINIIELNESEQFVIDSNFSIHVVKDGFYDSALIVEVDGVKLFNLNDCEISSPAQLTNLRKRFGGCDVLVSQFSYAAWKGGRENLAWRKAAAVEKLVTLARQAIYLGASIVIPFASFVRFSSVENAYLNDCMNTPRDVVDYFARNCPAAEVFVLKPMDALPLKGDRRKPEAALEYWDTLFQRSYPPLSYDTGFTMIDVVASFERYRDRLLQNNSIALLYLISSIPLAGLFRPVVFLVYDLNQVVRCDLISGRVSLYDGNWDIRIHSKSLVFLFNYSYGFDTLTVNGCFEANGWPSFSRFTRSFSLESLNGIGIFINMRDLFKLRPFILFITRLYKVRRRMMSISKG